MAGGTMDDLLIGVMFAAMNNCSPYLIGQQNIQLIPLLELVSKSLEQN